MMLPKEDLAKVVRDAGVELEQLAGDGPRIVTSCGSGLTACVIGLGSLQSKEPGCTKAFINWVCHCRAGQSMTAPGVNGVPIRRGLREKPFRIKGGGAGDTDPEAWR